MSRPSRHQRPTARRMQMCRQGFTLIELVIVIALTAVVLTMVTVFIQLPVRGYIETVARADLVDTADTALRRMARDIRLALPNSVRVSTDAGGNAYLELLLTRSGGRYLSADDNPTSGNVLDYVTGNTSFDVIGTMPTGVRAIQTGDSVVVYNLGPGVSPADAYETGSQSNRALISSMSGNTITMASNPFSAQSPAMPSPAYRFHVISGPVTYRWDATALTLTRYANYTISASQPTTIAALSTGPNAYSALMGSGISACTFAYSTTSSISNAIVTLLLTMSAPAADNATSGAIRLFQQVHVDNTP